MRHYECCIKPQPGEIISTAIPLPPESEALIIGTVQDGPDHPVSGVLVLLLRHKDGILLSSTVTDAEGRFYLGPVEPGELYTLRIQAAGVHTRILELTV